MSDKQSDLANLESLAVHQLPPEESPTAHLAAGRVLVVKLCSVIYDPDDCDYAAIVKKVQDAWREQHGDHPPMPIFVLPPGCDFAGVIE